jgi:hypothetical protein
MVNNRSKGYRSISEIEERFFPKSKEEKLSERPSDPATLGMFLAEESLIKIRSQLG